MSLELRFRFLAQRFCLPFVKFTFFYSYACDEFVINDTKSGDIQRVREIILERENRYVCTFM